MSICRVLVVAVVAVSLAGCGLLGIRQDIGEDQARALLDRAVAITTAGDLEELCGLSRSEASTCTDTLDTAGALAPDTRPQIDCVVEAPDDGPLRGGMILVLSGTDSNDDPYVTEFVVFDDGDRVSVLDAVWWSGLSIKSYGGDTVTWRFDSGSTTCTRGGLPVGTDPPATPGVPTPVEAPTVPSAGPS